MDESNESSQARNWFVSPKVTMSAFTAVPTLVKKSVQWTFDLVIDLGPTVVVDGAPAEMSEKVRRTERGLVVTGVRHDNDWTLTIQDEYERRLRLSLRMVVLPVVPLTAVCWRFRVVQRR